MKMPVRLASSSTASSSPRVLPRFTKPSLIVAGLLIAGLAIAAPALAAYTGPDRETTEFVTVRDPDNDVWTLTHVDPADGFSDVCLIIHTCDEHPSVERQLALCGWVADNSGGTMAFKTEEQTVTLPEATISAELQNCEPVDGWCTGPATLQLVGTEPLAGKTIDQIEGIRNGEIFVCGGAECQVPLLQGENGFTFWAHSSYGDTSQMGTLSAKVDSLGPSVSIPDSWYIWEPVAISIDDAGVGVAQVTFTIDGGSYGLRKYSWGNLNLVPDGFIWDRHFGEIVAPIGQYPVTVTATDTLGNGASALGEIVIPDPSDSTGLTSGLGVSSNSDPDTVGLSASAGSLDALLERLPVGDRAAGAEGTLISGSSRLGPVSNSGPTARSAISLARPPANPR